MFVPCVSPTQSNEFVSRVLAMVAERREIKAVLDELLGEAGASLRIRDAAHYCAGEERLSFAHLAKRAADSAAEIVVGFCDGEQMGGAPQLNPASKYELRCWAGAEIIVLERYAGDVEDEEAGFSTTTTEL